jgi:TRAP-type C4-dicarboxylate transport system permease small subunit
MYNIETRYTCDTFTIQYNGYDIVSINRWIIRPVLQLFIMLCAAGMCAASIVLTISGTEDVGFATLAILSGLMFLMFAVLLIHTCYTMFRIKRVIRQAAYAPVADFDDIDRRLTEVQQLANTIPMC